MTATRGTADARRAQAVDAGLRAFGEHGLTTAAVTQVAKEMGVSQPYIFRLFGSKRAFFLACMDELEDRELAAFTGDGRAIGESFEEMGAVFRSLVADGTLAGFSIQALAIARSDAEVAERYLRILSTTLRTVRERTGASGEELTLFLARGVLIVQLQTLGIDVATTSSTQAIESLLDRGDTE